MALLDDVTERGTRRRLGGIVALVLAIGAVAFVVDRTSLSADESVDSSRGQVSNLAVADGRLLYVQHCASCHGDAGQGTQLAPPITGSGTAGLDFYMRTGRMPLAEPGRPQWEQQQRQLTDEQIAAITAFAAQFTNGPEIPSVVADMRDLGRGWELYTNNCAACHAAGGGGGSVGGGVNAPAVAGLDALTVAEAMLVGPGAMPQFAFPHEDVEAIAGYVAYLADVPSPGGFAELESGPVPEGFIAGVIGLTLLVVIVRWVAKRERPERETNG